MNTSWTFLQPRQRTTMNTEFESRLLKSRREFLRSLGRLGALAPASILALESQIAKPSQRSRLWSSPPEHSAVKLGFSLTDVAKQAGLGQAINITGGKTRKRNLLEEMGCGAAFFDYDNDGWMDIFMVNGTTSDWPSSISPPSNFLFQIIATGLSPMSPGKLAWSEQAGDRVVAWAITTTTASTICSSPIGARTFFTTTTAMVLSAM